MEVIAAWKIHPASQLLNCDKDPEQFICGFTCPSERAHGSNYKHVRYSQNLKPV